jgi:hypothetical protein
VVGRGSRRVLGWVHGGAVGSAAPALARHCAVLVRRGWRTGTGEKHGHNQ